jgi:hypothetical protein
MIFSHGVAMLVDVEIFEDQRGRWSSVAGPRGNPARGMPPQAGPLGVKDPHSACRARRPRGDLLARHSQEQRVIAPPAASACP